MATSSSSNPSDYEFLLKTVLEGNYVARAQSLKRLNLLVVSDKKQFATYAKRVVIAIQDLLMESKEQINLLACTLALEIINLNPRDIQFYIRTKLLKNMVINLGDAKPQIRKTSHYSLLAFIKTYKNFDDLIDIYLTYGVSSPSWQLRQKSINSFQSILIMEMRYVNWQSGEFRKIVEVMLAKLRDQSAYVQKAAEQCLLSLSKMEEMRTFAKKLLPSQFNLLKSFMEAQLELGNINEIKLDLGENIKMPLTQRPGSPVARSNSNTVSMIHLQRMKEQKVSLFKQVSIDEVRTKITTPKIQQKVQRISLKKAQSVIHVGRQHPPQKADRYHNEGESKKESILPPIHSSMGLLQTQAQTNPKQEKIQTVLGRKVIDDLKNDKDWKIRLEAVQQIQTKFQMYKEEFEGETLTKHFLPIFIKLLGDANFKVALIALKIVQEILRIPNVNLEAIVPPIVQKLSDNKVALRQNISKLIKSEYNLSKQSIWIDNLVIQLKKASNSSNIKQEILSILGKIYEDGDIEYPFEKIIEAACPLMDDLKTKIKIKTLDLLVTITIKTGKIDKVKSILSSRMNQVYYQMFLQKIGKEMKGKPNAQPQKERGLQSVEKDKNMKGSLMQIRRISKISGTTSTSLQRYASSVNNQSMNPEQNATVKSFYDSKKDQTKIFNKLNGNLYEDKLYTNHNDSFENNTEDEGKKKSEYKQLRKRGQKTFDLRSLTTNYSNSNQQGGFPPFSDPGKQLKSILVDIKSDDWQIGLQTLAKLRRIILNHQDLLSSSTIKAIVPDLMKLTQSLRSTLSKNAVIVVNELSTKVKRQLDSQIQMIFTKIIKKTLDTNSFISQEVKKALVTLCSNSNESKILTLLTNAHTSRAIPIKTVIVHILQNITFLPRMYEKELERIVVILVDFMGEGSLEIRQKTKGLLNSILTSEKGGSILKLIPQEQRIKLKKREETQISTIKLPPKETKQENSEIKPAQIEEIYPRKKKREKIFNFPQEFSGLDNLLENCESGDWKLRLQNMTEIFNICKKYPEQISQHRTNSKIIDVLSKQINDPNTKVATNALKIFKQLSKIIPALIQNSLSVILNEIFNCFSSQKTQIRQLSEQLFDNVSQNVEKWMLIQHLCNGSLYGLQKSRSTIIQKLTKLVADAYRVKPNIFQKNVYPMINKVAQENKPQLNPALKSLIQTICKQVGQDSIGFLKPKAKELIFQ